MKKITLEYLMKDHKEFQRTEIALADYYDPIEPGEVLEIDSTPKFSHPYQYVTFNTSELVFLNLKIMFDGESIEFKQTFWNNGENILTERIDIGKEPYKVLILHSKIAGTEGLYEILRVVYKDNKMYPVSHVFIKDKKDGTQEEVANLYLEKFQKEIYNH